MEAKHYPVHTKPTQPVDKRLGKILALSIFFNLIDQYDTDDLQIQTVVYLLVILLLTSYLLMSRSNGGLTGFMLMIVYVTALFGILNNYA